MEDCIGVSIGVTCFFLKLSLKNKFRFLGNAENFEYLELF